MAGNAIGRGVVLDTSRYMNAIVSADAANRTTVVEPGSSWPISPRPSSTARATG